MSRRVCQECNGRLEGRLGHGFVEDGKLVHGRCPQPLYVAVEEDEEEGYESD